MIVRKPYNQFAKKWGRVHDRREVAGNHVGMLSIIIAAESVDEC